MDRQEKRAASRRMCAKHRGDFARLVEIESIERLIGQKNCLRRHETDCEKHAFALTFRKGTYRLMPQAIQAELFDSFVADFPPPAKKTNREVEYPPNGLGRPWRNTVRKIKEQLCSLLCVDL